MSFIDLDSYKLEDAAQAILKEGKLISHTEVDFFEAASPLPAGPAALWFARLQQELSLQ